MPRAPVRGCVLGAGARDEVPGGGTVAWWESVWRGRREGRGTSLPVCRGAGRGQAMVEFVLVMPLLLFAIFIIMQIALICVARHMTHYAAYCAARAAIVNEDADGAAALALCPVTGLGLPGGLSVPEMSGSLPSDLGPVVDYAVRYGIARYLKSKVEVEGWAPPETTEWGMTGKKAKVTFLYQLDIPLVNRALAYPWESFLGMDESMSPMEWFMQQLGWSDWESLLSSAWAIITGDWDFGNVPITAKNAVVSELFQWPHWVMEAECALPNRVPPAED